MPKLSRSGVCLFFFALLQCQKLQEKGKAKGPARFVSVLHTKTHKHQCFIYRKKRSRACRIKVLRVRAGGQKGWRCPRCRPSCKVFVSHRVAPARRKSFFRYSPPVLAECLLVAGGVCSGCGGLQPHFHCAWATCSVWCLLILAM